MSYDPGKTQDFARAEEILRRGYAATGVREAEHITERLADIWDRTGRPHEAGESRRRRKGPEARLAGDGLGGADRAGRRAACREAVPGREDRTEPAVPLRKREEVQEVLRCPASA